MPESVFLSASKVFGPPRSASDLAVAESDFFTACFSQEVR